MKLTTVREGKTTEQVRDCMGSHPLEVKTFIRAFRGHSRMENNCHRVLDVTCPEAESRTREKCALGIIACPAGSHAHAGGNIPASTAWQRSRGRAGGASSAWRDVETAITSECLLPLPGPGRESVPGIAVSGAGDASEFPREACVVDRRP